MKFKAARNIGTRRSLPTMSIYILKPTMKFAGFLFL